MPPAQLSKSRIGLFGGTFDPVHIGHLIIAWEAWQRMRLERVVFIPCRQSPHKSSKTIANDAQRFGMLKSSLKSQAWAEISSHEIKRSAPSYSIDTVEYFQEAHPSFRLFWILGSDQWTTLPKWHRSEELRRKLEFIVFPRPHLAKPIKGWRKHDLNVRIDLSATQIRNLLAAETCPSWLLPPAAFRTIKRNRLYQNS